MPNKCSCPRNHFWGKSSPGNILCSIFYDHQKITCVSWPLFGRATDFFFMLLTCFLFRTTVSYPYLQLASINLNYIEFVYFSVIELHVVRLTWTKAMQKMHDFVPLLLGLSMGFDLQHSVITALHYTQQWEDDAPVGIRAIVKSLPCFVLFFLPPALD